MKASRAAVRQVRALEKTATSMERIEGLLGWMIANLQESEALPELPYGLQEPKVIVPPEEDDTTGSAETDDEGTTDASQPEKLEADSDESAVKPTEELKIDSIEPAAKLTEEVEVSLPVTKVG